MKKKRKIRKKNSLLKGLIITIVAFAIVIAGVCAYLFFPSKGLRISNRTVNGYDVRDYDKAELQQILTDEIKWSMKLVDDEICIELENPLVAKIEPMLEDAYSMHRGFSYEICVEDEEIEDIVNTAIAEALKYEVSPSESNELMKYDETSDSFVYSDEVETAVLNKDALKNDLTEALKNKEYEKEIKLVFDRQMAEISSADFKLLSTFQTNTTANSNRNTNIENACASVNGTVLLPGESFSYNETLGERTEEKGYKLAGAYLNGEHVDQIGGGICQVSSTIFNAVFGANLQVDERSGHTFEPTYVKPGLDATVSYPKPDFVFSNNTKYPVGLLAHYADRVVTVEVYGVPTLEEGVTRYMTSEKIASYDVGYVYEDNGTLQYNQQVITKAPKAGSRWVTYEILEKDGEQLSKNPVYYTTYKGEPGIVQRNLAMDNYVAQINGTPLIQPGQAVPVAPAAPAPAPEAPAAPTEGASAPAAEGQTPPAAPVQ